MGSPQIKLIHTDGCSPDNTESAKVALQGALLALGLPGDRYEVIQVTTEAESLAHGFVGGPAVLVDGIDVDPNVRDMRPGGLGCRAYLIDGGIQGFPSQTMIEAALREVLE